jgi:hypothetical protein
MQDNVLCDGLNINNYLRLNSCMNVPHLLLQLLCLLPINRGFMYFLSNGNRTTDNIKAYCSTFIHVFKDKMCTKVRDCLYTTVPAAVLFLSVHTRFPLSNNIIFNFSIHFVTTALTVICIYFSEFVITTCSCSVLALAGWLHADYSSLILLWSQCIILLSDPWLHDLSRSPHLHTACAAPFLPF